MVPHESDCTEQLQPYISRGPAAFRDLRLVFKVTQSMFAAYVSVGWNRINYSSRNVRV